MAEEFKPRDCPACEQPTDAMPLPAYSTDEWRLGSCQSCGFVYLLNPPATSALVDEFAFEKTYAQQRARRRSSSRAAAAWIRSRLKPRHTTGSAPVDRLFPTGKVLDVGCGSGHRLSPPVIPFGIEISRTLFEAANQVMQSRGGYCLHASGLDGFNLFDSEFFDGILMHSYLEHEVDALPVLRNAHRCLKPGGNVFVRVPNYASINRRVFGSKWCGFRHPDHVNYFSPASLAEMARKAGFRMEILNRFGFRLMTTSMPC